MSKVSKVSSISPCRQFEPSIRAVEATGNQLCTAIKSRQRCSPMLPAPKAEAGTDRNARKMAQDRKNLKEGEKYDILKDESSID